MGIPRMKVEATDTSRDHHKEEMDRIRISHAYIYMYIHVYVYVNV